jgi:hypothetical protein
MFASESFGRVICIWLTRNSGECRSKTCRHTLTVYFARWVLHRVSAAHSGPRGARKNILCKPYCTRTRSVHARYTVSIRFGDVCYPYRKPTKPLCVNDIFIARAGTSKIGRVLYSTDNEHGLGGFSSDRQTDRERERERERERDYKRARTKRTRQIHRTTRPLMDSSPNPCVPFPPPRTRQPCIVSERFGRVLLENISKTRLFSFCSACSTRDESLTFVRRPLCARTIAFRRTTGRSWAVSMWRLGPIKLSNENDTRRTVRRARGGPRTKP